VFSIDEHSEGSFEIYALCLVYRMNDRVPEHQPFFRAVGPDDTSLVGSLLLCQFRNARAIGLRSINCSAQHIPSLTTPRRSCNRLCPRLHLAALFGPPIILASAMTVVFYFHYVNRRLCVDIIDSTSTRHRCRYRQTPSPGRFDYSQTLPLRPGRLRSLSVYIA